MPFHNPQANTTPEQEAAAKATLILEQTVGTFIQQSQKVERSNRCLTYFIIFLSVVQVICAVVSLLITKE